MTTTPLVQFLLFLLGGLLVIFGIWPRQKTNSLIIGHGPLQWSSACFGWALIAWALHTMVHERMPDDAVDLVGWLAVALVAAGIGFIFKFFKMFE